MPFAEKLDAPLAGLCNEPELASSARVPVVVRYEGDVLGDIVRRVTELGGTVRHELAFVHAVAAWLPLVAIPQLAQERTVRALELEQEFTIA